MPMRGVMKSLTSDFTTEVNAAPITMPTARSTTLPRSTNVRKPDRSSRRVPERTMCSSRSRGSWSLMPVRLTPTSRRTADLGPADVPVADRHNRSGDAALDRDTADTLQARRPAHLQALVDDVGGLALAGDMAGRGQPNAKTKRRGARCRVFPD